MAGCSRRKGGTVVRYTWQRLHYNSRSLCFSAERGKFSQGLVFTLVYSEVQQTTRKYVAKSLWKYAVLNAANWLSHMWRMQLVMTDARTRAHRHMHIPRITCSTMSSSAWVLLEKVRNKPTNLPRSLQHDVVELGGPLTYNMLNSQVWKLLIVGTWTRRALSRYITVCRRFGKYCCPDAGLTSRLNQQRLNQQNDADDASSSASFIHLIILPAIICQLKQKANTYNVCWKLVRRCRSDASVTSRFLGPASHVVVGLVCVFLEHCPHKTIHKDAFFLWKPHPLSHFLVSTVIFFMYSGYLCKRWTGRVSNSLTWWE